MTGPYTAPAGPPATGPQPTVTELVSGIINDAQRLARQQIDMLKAEFKEDLRRTKRATVFGAIGVVLATVGGLTLVAFLVEFLHEQFHFTMWASCLIIGGILIAGGVALGIVAQQLFESFNPLPDKTFNALQENLTWKTEPQM
jgi:hypothetical protein